MAAQDALVAAGEGHLAGWPIRCAGCAGARHYSMRPTRRRRKRAPLSPPAGRPLAPLICLAVAVAGSGAILLVLQSHLTFYADEWEFLLRPARIERRGLPRPARRSHRRWRSSPSTSSWSRSSAWVPPTALPGRLDALLPAQRRVALRLPAPARRRLAGASRERPDPLPRCWLDRSALALPDRLLGLDRGRAGRPASSRPRRSRGRRDRLCAPSGFDGFLGDRRAVRRRGAGQHLGERAAADRPSLHRLRPARPVRDLVARLGPQGPQRVDACTTSSCRPSSSSTPSRRPQPRWSGSPRH